MRRIARGSWLSRRQASADLDENTPCGFYADRDRWTRLGAASEGHLVARLVSSDLRPHSVLHSPSPGGHRPRIAIRPVRSRDDRLWSPRVRYSRTGTLPPGRPVGPLSALRRVMGTVSLSTPALRRPVQNVTLLWPQRPQCETITGCCNTDIQCQP
jgi:hypothetical protein